jgi:hypothetical protein
MQALLEKTVEKIGGFEIVVEPFGGGYCAYVERTAEGGDTEIFDGPSLEAALREALAASTDGRSA